jgi:hypothetical protein
MEKRMIDLNVLDAEMCHETFAIYVKRNAGWRCEKCGSNDNLEAHHIVLRSKGGKSTLTNGICLYEECHKKEHAAKFKIKAIINISLPVYEYAYKMKYIERKYKTMNDVYVKLIEKALEDFEK